MCRFYLHLVNILHCKFKRIMNSSKISYFNKNKCKHFALKKGLNCRFSKNSEIFDIKSNYFNFKEQIRQHYKRSIQGCILLLTNYFYLDKFHRNQYCYKRLSYQIYYFDTYKLVGLMPQHLNLYLLCILNSWLKLYYKSNTKNCSFSNLLIQSLQIFLNVKFKYEPSQQVQLG